MNWIIKKCRRILYVYFILTGCTAEKKVLYELPVDMLPEVKVSYSKRCDEGYSLYKSNCAGCHDRREGNTKAIPDFTQEQLKGYELREANSRHEASLSEEKINAEELGKIITFFSYKKKSNSKSNSPTRTQN